MKNDVELLSELPETISKEQLCKLCHMSKSTALYLLESGLIITVFENSFYVFHFIHITC